jgi:hypothetical protein
MKAQLVKTGVVKRPAHHNFLVIGKETMCIFVCRVWEQDRNFYELISLDHKYPNRRESKGIIDGEKGYQLLNSPSEIKITI